MSKKEKGNIRKYERLVIAYNERAREYDREYNYLEKRCQTLQELYDDKKNEEDNNISFYLKMLLVAAVTISFCTNIYLIFFNK